MRIVAGVICLGLFGILMIYHGFVRILHSQRDKNPGEASMWGAVGVVLGTLSLALCGWMLLP